MKLSIALLVALVAATPADAFTNPLVSANSADPFMVRHRGHWYLTYTSPPARQLVVRRARTLTRLRTATPHVLWDPAASGEPLSRSRLLWAPELHRLRRADGKQRWYLHYSAGGGSPAAQRSHVLESTGSDPLGPYRFKATLKTAEYAIDGTVWRRPADGQLFFFWAGADVLHLSSSVFVAAMTDPWTLAGPRVLVSNPIQLWELIGLPINEAPAILVRGDRLHVIFSASYCGLDGYTLGRASVPIDADLLDPRTWIGAKHPRPVFASAPHNGVWAPGHAGFFRSPDGREDWMVYGATTAPGAPLNGQGCGGVRMVRAQRFEWGATGDPVFGRPARLGTPMAAPSGE